MNFEKPPGQNDENVLRQKVSILLLSDINPLEDNDFRNFLHRYFITEGDAQKIIDEEREKLREKKEKAEKEFKRIRSMKRE